MSVLVVQKLLNDCFWPVDVWRAKPKETRYVCRTRFGDTFCVYGHGFSWSPTLEYFQKIFGFGWNLTRITGTVHGGLCTFMIIYRWVLLEMRNASDKSCTEYQNTHFVFNNFFFSEKLPFMRKLGKIFCSYSSRCVVILTYLLHGAESFLRS
jgi:hypothetical protein